MGYEVFQEYTDQESGTKSDRPAFTRLFSDGAKRKFDLLLFWSLDRFSREGTRKTIFYLQQLDDYGILYKSFTEQYLDSTGIFKDVIISILATLAKQEQIRLSERVRAGMNDPAAEQRGITGIFSIRPKGRGTNPIEIRKSKVERPCWWSSKDSSGDY